LFGNGDIHSLEDAMVRIRETRVDGVLVGRAVLGAPWFFRSKERIRELVRETDGSGVELRADDVSLDQRFAVLLDHGRQFQALCGQKRFYRMRKHLGWYCKGFPHAAALRSRMVQVSSFSELEGVLNDYRASRVLDSVETEPTDETDMPASRCG